MERFGNPSSHERRFAVYCLKMCSSVSWNFGGVEWIDGSSSWKDLPGFLRHSGKYVSGMGDEFGVFSLYVFMPTEKLECSCTISN